MTDQTNKWKTRYKKMGAELGIPKGLKEKVWKELIEIWGTENCEIRSQKNSRNRKSDPYGTGLATHRSGQTSFVARARAISEKTGDDTPDLLQVLIETKRKKDGDFVDKPSADLYKEVTDKMEELQHSDPESMGSVQLTASQKNDLYKQAAPRKKGRLYGVGSLHSYVDGSGSSSFSSRSDDGLQQVIAAQQEKIHQLEAENEKKTKDHDAFKAMFVHLASTSQDPFLQQMLQSMSGSSSQSPGPSNNDQ